MEKRTLLCALCQKLKPGTFYRAGHVYYIIAPELGIPQSTYYYYIRKLEREGLLKVRRETRSVYIAVLDEVCRKVCGGGEQ